MERAQFRYNVSISLAGVLAFIGAIPIATVGFGHENAPAWAYPLLLILIIPLAIAVWGWRAGTDASSEGLRVRALFGSRRIPWTGVDLLAPHGRRVYAQLTDGRTIKLAAVSRADLPRLVAASGRQIDDPQPVRDDSPPTTDGASSDDAEPEPATRS